jgi:hypothetical protein
LPHRRGRRLRRRYARVCDHLFTFPDHPGIAADNNGSERELRPTATYRKITGGFGSPCGADLFAAVGSIIYGGTPSTDRNLYVDSIAYDGVTGSGTTAALLWNNTDASHNPKFSLNGMQTCCISR